MPGLKETVKEEVDISVEAEELGLSDSGSLVQLDEKNRINLHWFKEKIIAWLSLTVIIVLLFLSVYLIVFSTDPEAQNWGRQVATTLLGFAAGAIWQVQKKK